MIKFIAILFLSIPSIVHAEYKNTNGTALEKSFFEMLKWIRSDQEPVLTSIEISSQWKDFNLLEDDNYAIWIGHSTFLIKKNGVSILTDPIFSERASPFKNIGPKRLISAAIPLQAIPKIDYVTISHNHYDHLDINSLIAISKKHPETIFLVPAGDADLLKRKSISNVYEFEWWQSYKDKEIEFTFTPVQHWSKRGLFDRNKSLWGGWYMRGLDYSLYHAGDTGYSNDFKETKLKLGSPKYAFIPIGAYDPEWFMAASHVNPEDAVQIMKDLGAEKAFGMHWATFVLTDEDTLEPKQRLKEATQKANDLDFISLIPGEIINLD
jgi:L-ascorbate metabolism protein UlaG (beta-lactamase superfamily)